jgi:hypothetical protein
MNWYVACLLVQPTRQRAVATTLARECLYLIRAASHDEAYSRASEIGGGAEGTDARFLGIRELLMMYGEPADQEEIMWHQSEMSEAEIRRSVRSRNAMRAFREQGGGSGWYAGSALLREVHDEGSHGRRTLVWINTYLIRAQTPEEALRKTARIGRAQQGSPGSHLCGGEKAHWDFVALSDLVPVAAPPAPGSLLWCDKISYRGDLRRRIPQKSELGVFRWEAQQARSRPGRSA